MIPRATKKLTRPDPSRYDGTHDPDRKNRIPAASTDGGGAGKDSGREAATGLSLGCGEEHAAACLSAADRPAGRVRPEDRSSAPGACPALGLIKWVGKKQRILPAILAHVPATFDGYFEPFLGSGALFWELAHAGRLTRGRVWLSDVNTELVHMYLCVKYAAADVARVYLEMRELHGETYYYHLRDDAIDDGLTPVERAARVLYLSSASFNGLWRENRRGRMNAPWGQRASVPDRTDAIMCAGHILNALDVNITRGDFASVPRPGPGDFAYADPPYLDLNAKMFVSYAKGGFAVTDHMRLAAWLREGRRRGATVLASNADSAAVRGVYHDFTATPVSIYRGIGCTAASRGMIHELLLKPLDAPLEIAYTCHLTRSSTESP